ncbi:hypothetical protein LSTR_LSTR007076 [Laodelphax striatellus]|uniref:Uncharacterized protein n=1 Tax=Laodelphax striatellus TaxID=195883 RepID=A0A482WJR3_LAOST|nr:hypothetical protein LSTR_LSTR007076 [Laodelphax striatellus]
MSKSNVDSLELGVNSASGSGEISAQSFSGEITPRSFSEDHHRAVDAQELNNSLLAVIDSQRKFVSIQIDEEEEDGANKSSNEDAIYEFGDGEEQGLKDNPVPIADGNQIILDVDPEQRKRNKRVRNEFRQYPIGGKMEKFRMDFVKYFIIGLILYITYRTS